MDAHQSDKLDLYSVPVFILELVILLVLAYAAHYIHFQYKHEPYLTGFYCDDTAIRHEYRESKLTEQFSKPDNELVVLSLLLVVPIVVIIFCELVNSMFGSLKFRQIRALCKCCKLHSITRRTIRFSGAYVLGFLLVMISCDILASTTGKLKPYFAQECPNAFKDCPRQMQLVQGVGGGVSDGAGIPAALLGLNPDETPARTPPASRPSLGSPSEIQTATMLSEPIANNLTSGTINALPPTLIRERRQVGQSSPATLVDRRILQRQWIWLEGVNLVQLCAFSGDSVQEYKFERLARSWPSFPASIVTYACLYVSAYLCFVGTARPFRVITSVLVVSLLLTATVFNVGLVSEHFNHWEDSVSGAILALLIVIFVLLVYLNKFRDTHFYRNQKLPKRSGLNNVGNAYSNEIALEQYSLDKTDDEQVPNTGGSGAGNPHLNGSNNIETLGSLPNNDLPMRYFQIPRANYRGAPRPLSSNTNHM